nr:uncharacterized protein LOC114826892 [Malus domestica]
MYLYVHIVVEKNGIVIVRVFSLISSKRRLSCEDGRIRYLLLLAITLEATMGNLIIYIPGSDGSTTSYWYGYVTPDDVPEFDQHIGKGEIIERLWRVQIGASCDEAEKINDPKLPNGGESKKIEEMPQGNGNWIENNENFSGCCQSSRVWSRSSSTADLCKHLLHQPQWCCTRPRAGLREH